MSKEVQSQFVSELTFEDLKYQIYTTLQSAIVMGLRLLAYASLLVTIKNNLFLVTEIIT